MAYAHYDRLSALDQSFLAMEDGCAHMHVGAVGIFDGAPLRARHGGLDQERIFAAAEAAVGHHPRFRQKLTTVPLFGSPVWVDDDHFNLHYHLRFTALPRPGDVRQLKRLTGRIMSQELDRGKPLWEMWFVEGLEDDGFAIISKVHHCMVDGIAGADLMTSMMRPEGMPELKAPGRWMPRPEPAPARLLLDETLRRAATPLLLARAGRELLADPARALRGSRAAVRGLVEALVAGLSPASPSPLNVDIGPHRRFDWARLDLGAIKRIKDALGGTVNDVVLAIVTGAMRRFLRARGESVSTLDFRAMMPVNVRATDDHGALGNRITFLMTRLPVGERDPRARLRAVTATTQTLKSSNKTGGTKLLEEIGDRTFASLFIEVARLGARSRSFNMVVTNVPGPQFPVAFLDARMRAVYPLVPLFTNQALGIALFSYDGGLYWGFNADWDAIPDLHEIVGHVEHEFRALHDAAGIAGVRPAAPARRTRKVPRRRPARAARR